MSGNPFNCAVVNFDGKLLVGYPGEVFTEDLHKQIYPSTMESKYKENPGRLAGNNSLIVRGGRATSVGISTCLGDVHTNVASVVKHALLEKTLDNPVPLDVAEAALNASGYETIKTIHGE